MFPQLVMMRVLDLVFYPLTLGTTISRFEARRQKKVTLGLDDFFALLALLTYCALLGVLKWGQS